MYVLNFIRGFCMSLADSVPGVSGGTIAFILGFYDDFLKSLNLVISGDMKNKIIGFKFLYKIGIGWIFGFLTSILFIASIFENNIYEISSLFLGFIIASIPSIIKSEKKILFNNLKSMTFLILGVIIVLIMTNLSIKLCNDSSLSISVSNLSIPLIIYIFVSGMVSISAMVLPGISGASILLIFGLYVSIITAMKEIFSLNFEYLPGILIFCLGVLLGIFLSIKGIRRLLKNYRASTIYCILGLMIGSLYSVIMGPLSLEIPKPSMSINEFNLLFFIIGCFLVPSLESIKLFLNKK